MKKIIPAYILMMALMSCSPKAVKETPRRVQPPTHEIQKDNTQEIQKPGVKHKVAIYSGHMQNPSGSDRIGATSTTGVYEYRYNDDLTSKFTDDETIDFMIYPSTENIPLKSRTDKTDRAELYLELHHDAVQDESRREYNSSLDPRKAWDAAKGYSLFVNPKSKESMDLARMISESLRSKGFIPNKYHKKDILGERRTMIDTTLGIYDGNWLYIIGKNKKPAILIECGVIVNPYEEPNHRDPEFHNKFAKTVSLGISEYYKSRQE